MFKSLQNSNVHPVRGIDIDSENAMLSSNLEGKLLYSKNECALSMERHNFQVGTQVV